MAQDAGQLLSHVAIADAMIMLGLSRRELLQRLRIDQIDDLLYVPSRGGWFLPRAAVDMIAIELDDRTPRRATG